MTVKCSNYRTPNNAIILNDLANEKNGRLYLQQLEILTFLLVLFTAITLV